MPICQLSGRALLRLSGPDVRTLLQGLLTQDVSALAPGHPLYAGLLSPQGKTLFQLFLYADGRDVLLEVAAADREELLAHLLRFRLRRQVAIENEDGLAVYQSWGEASAQPADPRTPLAGSRFPATATAASAGTADWQQQRLLLGLPDADEIGRDELLWLETNARELNGVSFTKGCYTGQENTARMHHKDRLRKRLLVLRLAGPAATGNAGPDTAVLTAGGREAGRLRGHRHGDLQMALLRTEFLDQPLSVAGHAATLLPPPWLTR